ncbi:MAG: DUF1592 domain-containing protein, partial [Verrucomicrobia bacterium]|nr:DUF1592 domain-containing protein [Verrucomicrobiota bacterium]
ECHGKNGGGVEGKYDELLAGDRSLEALARKIEKTMPEDNEGACVGEDAKQVAAYIFEAFYSPEAQARLPLPPKDLSRLTISQYRTSVADLIGHFRMGPGFDRPLAAETGLKGFYRGQRLPKPGEEAVDTTPKNGIRAKIPNMTIERVEPVVRFHFGADSPDKETMEADQFQNRWEGSVVAEETGLYEFSIKTENGARLRVNDLSNDHALIDAWVSSGPEVREEKRTINLLGGRAYGLMLEHFKFKEKSASIELWWKPPHGVKEIIPQRALRTDRPKPIMIVDAVFPADDRSGGYERGTTISRAWDQAITEAAVSVSEHVEKNIDELAGTKRNAPDRKEMLRKFAIEFAGAAFRRPLTDDLINRHIDRHFVTARTPDQAIKRIVLFTLKAPEFLYPAVGELSRSDDFAVASRLALALWDSIPDRRLMRAAAEGKLHTREQAAGEAKRMISDLRTRSKLQGYFHQWLELERAENIVKDPKAFPGFDNDVQADLRMSLLQFIDEVVWSEKSDYRELLQADYILLNSRLADIYGKSVSGEGLQRVSFDPKQRAGVVTHPYLLAFLAYNQQTSPIHRGVFLTRNIVGMALKPPPMAVAFDESHFDPKLTMREKITQLTRNDSCMSCHSVINPLGFSLENFDAIGRWRTQDNDKPVNPVAEFANEKGDRVHLAGPRDIVNYVANNPLGHRAFVRQLFNYIVKQQAPAYGMRTLDDLQRKFTASNCNIQKLLMEIALVAALDGVSTVSPDTASN